MLENTPSLVPFIMAGDPDMDSSLKFLRILDRYADAIELGIPFSDPIADGETIQRSSVRSLNSGTRVEDVFGLVARFREGSDTPIVLMTYFNLIYRRGVEKFLEDARDCGVTGMIVVDLPLEEASEYRDACRDVGIDTIFLIAPNTSLDRVAAIDLASTGYVYLVAHLGTTGERESIPGSTLELLGKVKGVCKSPVAVGFGISTPEHVSQLIGAKADAAIIGSSIVNLIERHGGSAGPYIEERISMFRRAADGTRGGKG